MRNVQNCRELLILASSAQCCILSIFLVPEVTRAQDSPQVYLHEAAFVSAISSNKVPSGETRGQQEQCPVWVPGLKSHVSYALQKNSKEF
jgi:hypothetical protein